MMEGNGTDIQLQSGQMPFWLIRSTHHTEKAARPGSVPGMIISGLDVPKLLFIRNGTANSNERNRSWQKHVQLLIKYWKA